jgi:hypothetical protein
VVRGKPALAVDHDGFNLDAGVPAGTRVRLRKNEPRSGLVRQTNGALAGRLRGCRRTVESMLRTIAELLVGNLIEIVMLSAGLRVQPERLLAEIRRPALAI